MDNSDQQLSSLFHELQFKDPAIKCSQNHPLRKICQNIDCNQSAFFCSDEECINFNKHLFCSSISLKGVTQLINSETQQQKQFLLKIFQLENEALQKIQKSRIAIIKTVSFQTDSKILQNFFNKLYKLKTVDGFEGRQMLDIYRQLLQDSKNIRNNKEFLLKGYSNSSQQLISNIVKIRNQVFDSFKTQKQNNNKVQELKTPQKIEKNTLQKQNAQVNNSKIKGQDQKQLQIINYQDQSRKKQVKFDKNQINSKNDNKQFQSFLSNNYKFQNYNMSKCSKSQSNKDDQQFYDKSTKKRKMQLKSQEQKIWIQSKIIERTQNPQQSLDFIIKYLNDPFKFQLIYRASEYNFSAQKFHKRCDNIANTLTIIKTQHDNVLCGFTPLKWNSAKYDFATDPSYKSFILSLTLFQKMNLQKSQFAIFCNPSCGPMFGNDLQIGDKCNQNINNICQFPHSYNYAGKKYNYNQKSISAFCGATQGNRFRILEYEVYKVVYDR